MRKKMLSLLLALTLALGAALPACAISAEEEMTADVLYTLGLVKGTGHGYELSREVSREEAAALIVRVCGKEKTALNALLRHPFSDVSAWAKKYVAYAYSKGLVCGVDAAHFNGLAYASAADYLTMLLRAMGYDDKNGDFSYATATLMAYRLGLTDTAEAGEFTRGAMFSATLRALRAPGKDGTTLLERLIEDGAVDAAVANAVGFGSMRRLTAREVADRYSSSVFQIARYDDEESIESETSSGGASGFFISEDGIAITCCHSIAGGMYGTATLLSGETFEIKEVLYYDKDIDIALIRISDVPVDGGESVQFPYLACVSSDAVHTGDVVYAIGCSLSLSNSVSAGVVSHMNREVKEYALPMIQNTASISQGSSGGALLNEYGQAVGVTAGAYVYGNEMYLSVPVDPVLKAERDAEGITLAQMTAQLEALAAQEETEE